MALPIIASIASAVMQHKRRKKMDKERAEDRASVNALRQAQIGALNRGGSAPSSNFGSLTSGMGEAMSAAGSSEMPSTTTSMPDSGVEVSPVRMGSVSATDDDGMDGRYKNGGMVGYKDGGMLYGCKDWQSQSFKK
jgi:hypothetical protein